MYINFKSDFSILVTFPEGIPTYPWRMLFRTEPSPATLSNEINSSYSGGYVARFDGTTYTRAKVLSGSETDILIEFKDHGLQPGQLRMEWDIMAQSDLFEDLSQRLVCPKLTPVTLVESAGDQIDTAMIPIVIPVARGDKGDPFTYDDFTAEQLAALKGEQGMQGEKGEKGDDGEQGAKGDPFTYADFTPEQIAALNKGEKGDPGEQGADGAKGDSGEPGAKGDRGEAFTYEDFTSAQLAALKGEKGEKGDKGDTGAAGAQGAKGDPFTYADFTPEQIAALNKGEKGDKGDPGDDGADGAQGAQGAKGEKGDKGDPFIYSDFTSAQLAALKGAKGDKGEQGEKGETGETGAQGEKGEKGDPGSGGGDSSTLVNSAVEIDENGIKSLPLTDPSDRGNIFDGLLGVICYDNDHNDEPSWLWFHKSTWHSSDSVPFIETVDGFFELRNVTLPVTAVLTGGLPEDDLRMWVLPDLENPYFSGQFGEGFNRTFFIYDSSFYTE